MDDLDVPKYLVLQSLDKDFERAVKLCESILSRIGKVYPSEEADDFDELEQIIQLFSRLGDLRLEGVPRGTIDEIVNETRLMAGELNNLDHVVKSPQPNLQDISDLLGSLAGRLSNILGVLQRWLPLLILQKAPIFEVATVERQLKKLAEDQETAIVRMHDSVDEAVKRAETAAESIEQKDSIAAEALGDIGVSKHAEKFAEVESSHALAAKWWFWGSVALLIFTAVVAWLLYYFVEIDNTWDSPKNIHKVLFKIAILTTLFYLIAQSIKNFRVNKHLEVTNRHRATALRTFQTFVVNAGEKEEVRNAILLETTRTIFAPVSTGYVDNEDDGPNNKIIEMINLGRGK